MSIKSVRPLDSPYIKDVRDFIDNVIYGFPYFSQYEKIREDYDRIIWDSSAVQQNFLRIPLETASFFFHENTVYRVEIPESASDSLDFSHKSFILAEVANFSQVMKNSLIKDRFKVKDRRVNFLNIVNGEDIEIYIYKIKYSNHKGKELEYGIIANIGQETTVDQDVSPYFENKRTRMLMSVWNDTMSIKSIDIDPKKIHLRPLETILFVVNN